jgi:DNA-binding transcriptional regulator YiaG
MTMKKTPVEIEFNGDELVAAVQDTVRLYREGRAGELRTTERKALQPMKPTQIRAIRKKWGASQAIFAEILNVPMKTYISWESGYKNPSGAALKLLTIAKEKPEALLVA